MKPSFAVVGCGRVGTNLAFWLQRAGYHLTGIIGKTPASCLKIAKFLPKFIPRLGASSWEIAGEADIVFITTSDDAIEKTCCEIAKQNGFRKKGIVLHCSGSLSSKILVSAEKNYAAIGSMHPLQSFASIQTEFNPFKGIVMSIEGNSRAVACAKAIAIDLGARPIEIPTMAKSLYHASAVTASNYLVTILDMAVRLMQSTGLSEIEAIQVLNPLIEGSLQNVKDKGTAAALTGPIARGDVETLRSHMKAIQKSAPDLLHLYKSLGMATVGIAGRLDTLSESRIHQMVREFETDPSNDE
jgi:predicted short-subunit dehydrogenase-like oxidoreductase (DUF2520 family)